MPREERRPAMDVRGISWWSPLGFGLRASGFGQTTLQGRKARAMRALRDLLGLAPRPRAAPFRDAQRLSADVRRVADRLAAMLAPRPAVAALVGAVLMAGAARAEERLQVAAVRAQGPIHVDGALDEG